MKIVVAGSRTIYPYTLDLIDLLKEFEVRLEDTDEIIHGGCPTGIDRWVENGYKSTTFAAAWATHGKAAGPIRNKEMAQYGDALLLIWDGESRGSKNMKEEMLKLKKPVYEVILRTHNVNA